MKTENNTIIEAGPFDLENACKRLLELLAANDVKRGSKKASVIEYGFVHGLVMAYGNVPYLTICLMSGRSILD